MMTFISLFFRLLLLLMVCSQSVGAQAPMQVRFAPEKDYGPFIFQDEKGQIRGLSWDILQSLAVGANLQLQVLPANSLATILDQAKQGQVDLISSLRPTPERAQYLVFSQPYVAVPAVLVAKEGDQAVAMHALAGQKVAVGKGFAVEAFVRERFPAVDWLSVSDDGAGLLLLKQGKVRAVVADVASVIFVSQKQGVKGLRVVQNIGFQYQLSFAFPKDQPELGKRIDEALLRFPLAQREALLAHWLDAKQIEEKLPFQDKLVWFALGLLVLALAVAAWLALRKGGPP